MSNLFLLNNSKSILLFPNGFSFLKKDTSGTILEQNYPNTSVSFLPPFAKDFFALSDNETETVDVIFDLFSPILIPKELYNESIAYDALGVQFDISCLGQLISEGIEEYRAVYFINHNELNLLQKINIKPYFIHISGLIFQYLQAHSVSQSDNTVSLFINDSYADSILIKSQKINLINRFNFTSEFDILYYLLNLIKQYGIKIDNCKIILFRNQSNKLSELLTKYFSDLEFIG
jgi:hypothetical protein